MITESTRWAVVIPREQFEKIKSSEDLSLIVALARAVNALHFVHEPLLRTDWDDTPASMRTRYNSLLFTCALFAEASSLVQGMHKSFGNNLKFKELAGIANSKESSKILSQHVWKLRKKFVFHFDAQEAQEQLSTLELQEPVFVTCLGTMKINTYNELADIVALRILIGSEFPKDKSRAKELIQQITKVVLAFLEAAEDFIVDVAVERHWTEVVLDDRS